MRTILNTDAVHSRTASVLLGMLFLVGYWTIIQEGKPPVTSQPHPVHLPRVFAILFLACHVLFLLLPCVYFVLGWAWLPRIPHLVLFFPFLDSAYHTHSPAHSACQNQLSSFALSYLSSALTHSSAKPYSCFCTAPVWFSLFTCLPVSIFAVLYFICYSVFFVARPA
ncbi:hypothetical protein AAFF_G00395470 [Aldrovandia affinis]|uniref:Transmembrane protein n=1 Tax=Aldrovandia affinis TaxID=143900 RepID=A0AAD7WKQ0_9TELE|nr:hypothetical protein AAFF_G00395470 [Aldrovandia affinis]